MVEVNPAALLKLNQPPAVAFPFIISETTGDLRQLILRGRSLPYRGVSWGADLRTEIKYFPGNPVAQAQVLGPTWGPTTMRGMWKDSFLTNDDSSVKLIGFPDIGTAGRPSTPFVGGKSFQSGGSVPGKIGSAMRARTVRDAFYLLLRAGQLLRVEWGSLVRFGFMKSFEPDHDREEDIRWEITFAWTSDTSAATKFKKQSQFNAQGLLARILAAIAAALDALNGLLALISGATTLISQRITRVGSLVSGLLDILTGFVSLAFVPAEMLGVLRQQLTGVILAAKDLADTARSVPASYGAAKVGASPAEINIAEESALFIAFNAAALGLEMVNQREELIELETPDLLGILSAKENTTLRDISTDFYGTPTNWTAIAEFNGLSSSIVPRGTILYIPTLDRVKI